MATVMTILTSDVTFVITVERHVGLVAHERSPAGRISGWLRGGDCLVVGAVERQRFKSGWSVADRRTDATGSARIIGCG
jgi:hypothetical protein